MYHDWAFPISLGVEVLPIELPGTNSRLKEPKATCLRALAQDVVQGIAAHLQPGQPPVVLWGHSMGAWLAYEVAQLLSAPGSGLQRPLHLFASGNRAPSLAGLEHNPDSHVMHRLEAAEFWRVYTQRYGANPDLESRALRAYLLPGLQADFKLVETYTPSSLRPLDCGVIALGGTSDPRYSPGQLEAWAGVAPPSRFSVQWFEGGHLFVREQTTAVLEFLEGKLRHLLPDSR